MKEWIRKSELAHLPQAPTLLESAAHNVCLSHTLVIADGAEKQNRIILIIGYT